MITTLLLPFPRPGRSRRFDEARPGLGRFAHKPTSQLAIEHPISRRLNGHHGMEPEAAIEATATSSPLTDAVYEKELATIIVKKQWPTRRHAV